MIHFYNLSILKFWKYIWKYLRFEFLSWLLNSFGIREWRTYISVKNSMMVLLNLEKGKQFKLFSAFNNVLGKVNLLWLVNILTIFLICMMYQKLHYECLGVVKELLKVGHNLSRWYEADRFCLLSNWLSTTREFSKKFLCICKCPHSFHLFLLKV